MPIDKTFLSMSAPAYEFGVSHRRRQVGQGLPAAAFWSLTGCGGADTSESGQGFFMEKFDQQAFDDASGNTVNFVPDNHARAAKGVVRGLHSQMPTKARGKLVCMTQDTVFGSGKDAATPMLTAREGSDHGTIDA